MIADPTPCLSSGMEVMIAEVVGATVRPRPADSTSSGQASEFQEPIKVKTKITIKGAFESGRTIWIRKRKCPEPSIRAASNNSSGIWTKNCLNMNMLKTLPMKGTVSAGQLLIQSMGPILPNQVTVRKLGIIVTMAGIIIVLKRIPKIKSRPGKFTREKP